MTTSIILITIWIYAALGIYFTLKEFDPKRIGSILFCIIFGAIFGTSFIFMHLIGTILVNILDYKIRK